MHKEVNARKVRVVYNDKEFSEFEIVTLFFTDTFLRVRGETHDYIIPFTNVCEISFERAE